MVDFFRRVLIVERLSRAVPEVTESRSSVQELSSLPWSGKAETPWELGMILWSLG